MRAGAVRGGRGKSGPRHHLFCRSDTSCRSEGQMMPGEAIWRGRWWFEPEFHAARLRVLAWEGPVMLPRTDERPSTDLRIPPTADLSLFHLARARFTRERPNPRGPLVPLGRYSPTAPRDMTPYVSRRYMPKRCSGPTDRGIVRHVTSNDICRTFFVAVFRLLF